MCITTDESVDPRVAELCETVFPHGATSPAFIDAAGSAVYMPGIIDRVEFAQEALALVLLSHEFGLLKSEAPLMLDQPSPARVRHQLVQLELRSDGGVQVTHHLPRGLSHAEAVEVTCFRAG